MNKCFAVIVVAALTVCSATAEDVPRVGTYLGYNYVWFNPSVESAKFGAHGGSAQLIYNFNRWVSGVADVGAAHNNRDFGRFGLGTRATNFVFGPRLSFRNSLNTQGITPYLQVLGGGVYANSNLKSETEWAMTAGGGIDVRLSRRVSLRPIAVDYYMTRLRSFRTQDDRQHNMRYSGGFTFWFGGETPTPPPPPQTMNCPDGSTVLVGAVCPKQDFTLALNATSRELCPGDSTPVVMSVSGAPQDQLRYSWSVNGQQVGRGPSYDFGVGREAGSYTIALTAEGDNFNPASAQTTVTVREYRPPTGTAQANPAQIRAGDQSTISASFQGQCGGPIRTPTFRASEGSMQGNVFDSTGVRFDAANRAEQRRTVTIIANAADNRTEGSATTSVEVIKAAALISAIRLPDVLFPVNDARVNNCGKRILLEQLRAYSERDPSGTVVLVGHSSSDERGANLANQRVMNAAAVITAGTGICLSIPQSQVQVSSPGAEQNGVPFESSFCQSSVGGGTFSEARRVEVWFVPTGGQLPSSVTNSQAATTLSLGSLGCPR